MMNNKVKFKSEKPRRTAADNSPPAWLMKFAVGMVSAACTLTLYGVFAQKPRSSPKPASQSGPIVQQNSDSARDMILSKANTQQMKTGGKEAQAIFNDPSIQDKWGLEKTSAAKAWEVTQGSKDIVVAVIDTGIDEKHKDLDGNLWINPGETGKDALGRDKATNGIDDDGDGYVDDVHGWNFAGANNNLFDNHGHGTHIAGIIGGHGNKDGGGYKGVAPKVSLMILKYYDPKAPASNNLKSTVDAIRYAIKMKANIINYSGGGTDFSAEENAVVKEAEKAGILFVAAAGNEKSNSDEPGKHYYPADYGLSNIISVTAVNKEEIKVLPSSNYGVRSVDIAAPGENINSTLPGNAYGKMTGTSQATAFVTGVAALVMAHNRDFTYSDVKKYILKTGDEYATLLSKTGSAKLLNSYRALTSLDRGVSFSGATATNTTRVPAKSFSLDQSLSNPQFKDAAALAEPTETMASFGKEFLRAIANTKSSAPLENPEVRRR